MKTTRYSIARTGPEVRIGHLSDLHFGKSPSTRPAFRTGLQRILDFGVDAIVVSGDLAQLPDSHEQLAEVRETLEAANVPYVTVSGNHDVAVPGEDGIYASYFGALPRIETIGDVSFLLFDSFGGLPVSERDPARYDDTWGCWTDGEVSEEQFELIEGWLDDSDELRLAVVHHHLDDAPHPIVTPLRNANRFIDWCADHDVFGVFVGHLHRPAPPAQRHGVWRFRTGRTTKAPHPVAVLDLVCGEYVVLTDEE